MALKKISPSLEKAIASLSTEKEVSEFIELLLSEKEIQQARNRWAAFQLGIKGATQRQVRDALGVSIATATRAARAAHENSRIVKLILKRVGQS